jgi:hypothetical protein
MKKIILSLIIVCAFTFASFAQAQFGMKVGLGLNHLSYKQKDTKIIPDPDKSNNIGGNIAFVFKYNIDENLFIQSGLGLYMKGGKLEWEYYSENYNLIYFVLPVNAGYSINKFDFFLGPYFAPCFGGAEIRKTDETTVFVVLPKKNKYTKTLGDKEDVVASWDIGLNFGVAYNLRPIKIGFGYDMGLSNMNVISKKEADSNVKRDDLKMKNGVISLNLTIMFGGNKN